LILLLVVPPPSVRGPASHFWTRFLPLPWLP
jgi:hypothetical protein